MKTYLVGGAVRDTVLGYPVSERDWVVVGGSPDELLSLGYQQVGRDFPVFLHPETREEYALARRERKNAPGYHGFSCEYDPSVTLVEDLSRRDLTINAMAMDDAGSVIDPYHGLADLSSKVLRHVSPAFIEDPVRVLRVARFMARYHHLGFRLANETRQLMYAMVKQGELAHLVPERVWKELFGSLSERDPGQCLITLRQCGALSVILPEVDALFGIPSRNTHHPEIDTGIHTLMVLSCAATYSPDPMIRFAAMVHDLGKAYTPMQAWPAQQGHGALGVPAIESLCARLRIPTDYLTFACLVSALHLDIHALASLTAVDIVSVLTRADAFRRPMLFEQLLCVCHADAVGRGRGFNAGVADYPQAARWRQLLACCMAVDVQAVIADGYRGAAIQVALYERRVQAINGILTI
jgi:tRNA nucleotidyltransferase (CCA-adding enzyme)